MNYPVGICSWSLGNDLDQVFQALEQNGLSHLHLAVDAIDLFRNAIAENNWTVSCTMLSFPQEDYSTLESIRRTGGMVPEDCWAQNRALAMEAIGKTAGMGVGFLSFHAGFIDHGDAAGYEDFCGRLRELANFAHQNRIMLLMETGQETAVDLRNCLEVFNHPALGVNFDPANMILYGKGDPIEAVKLLAPWIKHVHIKDATASKSPGAWGTEVPWGDGEVGCREFIQALEENGYAGALAVEREAGASRLNDIQLAVERLRGES